MNVLKPILCFGIDRLFEYYWNIIGEIKYQTAAFW